MLVIDSSYTFEMITQRGLEYSVQCRDLDGFFNHVWSVHPFATLLTSEDWTPRFGIPVRHNLGPRHTFIEGKIGRFGFLRCIPLLNFLASQITLFFELLSLIRRQSIKIVRVGDPLYLGLFGLALTTFTGTRLVIRVNGNNEKLRKLTGKPIFPRLFRSVRLEKIVERFVFRRADLVVAANRENLDFAISSGAKRESSSIFRYGNLLSPEYFVDPDARVVDFEFSARFGLMPQKFLLFVGRLQPLKLPEDAVEVLAEVRRCGHDVKLAFAGDGEMLNWLIELASRLGILDSIVFLGNQNQRTLISLYTHAAVVLSPLTGRALSEAALCRATIVAYDIDWQADLVIDGTTGALVKFRDIYGMAESTMNYLRNPEIAKEMGRNLRLHALELLDPKVLNNHERAEYFKLLS